MKKWLFAVLLGIVLTLGACGGNDDAADDNGDTGNDNGTEENAGDGAVDSAAGEEIYQSNCASCHGADLSGGAGPELTQVGSKYSKEDIENIVQNGYGRMPALNVAGDDLDALSSWLADKK